MQKSQVSIIYYTNLLITNLIQICIMTLWVTRVESIITIIIYYCVMMANLYFRMCIALERYLFNVCASLHVSKHDLCTVKHPYSQKYTIVHCDNQNLCFSCVTGIFPSHTHCWTVSETLRAWWWSVFWSGFFVLSVSLLP